MERGRRAEGVQNNKIQKLRYLHSTVLNDLEALAETNEEEHTYALPVASRQSLINLENSVEQWKK